MNAKYQKLVKIQKEAVAKNEDILINVYSQLISRLDSNMSVDEFELKIVLFMVERAALATTYKKKKNIKLADQELYCISLLSYQFLDGRRKPSITGNKVTISNE